MSPMLHETLSSPGLAIVGIGTEYPKSSVKAEDLEKFIKRHYDETPEMLKAMALNRRTGIMSRPSVLTLDDPLVNGPSVPLINELDALFKRDGVQLAMDACRKAMAEWGGDPSQITHMVSVTCTNTSNPGYDVAVAKGLGLGPETERILLHGVGCAGGLSAVRTAANVLCAASHRGRSARALVLATELTTPLVRSSLDSIKKEKRFNVGPILFSDCASALVMTNGISPAGFETPIYRVNNWKQYLIPGTESDIEFTVNAQGWKEIITRDIPVMCAKSIGPLFDELVRDTHPKTPNLRPSPQEVDWALHPGGLAVIEAVQQSLNLDQHHLRASYEVYTKWGNSSGATVLSVMDRMRHLTDGRRTVIACAPGPGMNIEMVHLTRY